MSIAVRCAFVLCIAAQLGSAQSTSDVDPLKKADLVVIGPLVHGAAVDNGTRVRCSGTLAITRLLKGESRGDLQVQVEWDYEPRPGEPPQVTTAIGQPYGLWALVPTDSGHYRPLRFAGPARNGGVCLELPDVQLSAALQYTSGVPASRKIASELAGGLEALAIANGDGLNVERHFDSQGGFSQRTSEEQRRFEAVARTLDRLDASEAAFAYQYFAGVPSANLRAVGIAGLLRAGDPSALPALVRQARDLAPTLWAAEIANGLSVADIHDAQGLEALGRVVTGEAELPGLDGRAAFVLGWTKTTGALPYLAVMLDHPDAAVRAQSMMAFCDALRPVSGRPSDLDRLWSAETMSAHCPRRAPMDDRNAEQRDIGFWKQWWTEAKPELARVAPLPEIRAPVRYRRVFDPIAPVRVEVPPHERLAALARMLTHTQAGDPGPLRPPGVTFGDADGRTFDHIIRKLTQDIEANMQKAREFLNQARIQNRPPDRAAMFAMNAEDERVKKQALERLRVELSPGGWAALERALNDMGISGMSLGPRP